MRPLVQYGILQRKVLERRAVGLAHLSLSIGFAGLSLGSLLVVLDTRLLRPCGVRLLAGGFAVALQGALDLCGLLLAVGSLGFLGRRLVAPSKGLASLLVVLGLAFLALSGFALEGLRMVQQPDPADAWAFVGSGVAGWMGSRVASLPPVDGMLVFRSLWWCHVLIALCFLAALPYTRLLHAFAAPLQLLRATPLPRPALSTPFDLMQLIESGNFDVKVGANSVTDLASDLRLSFLACTDCGRCEEACPAHTSGAALSPRELIQSLRGAVLEAGRGKAPADLLGGGVNEAQVWACRLCGACSEACPVLIHPPAPILELRRGLVAQGRLDRKQSAFLSNLASGKNPFGLPHSERHDLPSVLNPSRGPGQPKVATDGVLSAALRFAPVSSWRGEGAEPLPAPDPPLLYWIGCAATYDARARKIAESVVRILDRAGVEFTLLGGEESCCGEAARRLGEEGRFQELVQENLETFARHGVRKILTHCAHCWNTFRNEYPAFGGSFEAVHHSAFLRELLEAGRLPAFRSELGAVTLHDSCSIGRLNRGFDGSRSVLGSVAGLELREMRASREKSFCCGGGGASYWYDVPSREKVGQLRMRQALETGARAVVTECPYCLKMLEDAGGAPVRDVAEVVAESLGEQRC